MGYSWQELGDFMLHEIATQPWGGLYPYPPPPLMFDYRNELITTVKYSYDDNMAHPAGRTQAQIYQNVVDYFYWMVNQRIKAVNAANASAQPVAASAILPSWVQPVWATGFGIIGTAVAGPTGGAVGATVGSTIVSSGVQSAQATMASAAAAVRSDPAINQAISSGVADPEGAPDGAMAGMAGAPRAGLIPRFESWLYFPEAAAFYGNLNQLLRPTGA